jgi:hypothetical protein
MNKRQAKKLFDTEGTKKTRKQWSLAIRRGKMPNQHKLKDE